MRFYIFLLFTLLLQPAFAQDQNGFELDAGLSDSNSNMINYSMSGLYSPFKYCECLCGISGWSSHIKRSWNITQSQKIVSYTYDSQNTSVTVQLGVRLVIPIYKFNDKVFALFAQPYLTLNPFPISTVKLDAVDFAISNPTPNQITTQIGENERQFTKSNYHFFHGGAGYKLGASLRIENFLVYLSYGFNNLDLFKNIKGLEVDSQKMNLYLPSVRLVTYSVGLVFYY